MEFSVLMDATFTKALIKIAMKYLHLRKQAYGFHMFQFSAFWYVVSG